MLITTSPVTCVLTAVCNLPEDESESIDVGTSVRIKLVCFQSIIQDFRCQVSYRPDTVVWRYVDGISCHVMFHSQT